MKIEKSIDREETEAAQYGIDLDLLERTLQMTPDERVRAHDRALAMANELREAVKQTTFHHEKSDSAVGRGRD